MGRSKRKNRTHLKDPSASSAVTEGAPKSFIIKHGQVGHSLAQLVRDVRKVMEPNTASRLRERARNKLKDYLTMAPALQVTHLLAFTLTPIASSLRIVRLSAGPTLSFRVERYSLMKDLLSSKRARSVGMEYLSPPLLVLASFPPITPSTPPHISLVIKTFQSLFPSLSPQSLSVSSARRVVLVSYNAENGGTIDVRHYIITIKAYGVSKRVRKVLSGPSSSKKSGFIDLGNEKDVADFLLRKRGVPGPGSEGGYESAVSSEDEGGGDDAISLPGDYPGRNNRKGSKRAVRLDEVGPRMELRLIKIMDGVPGKQGEVLFHEFVKKSKGEVKKQQEEFREKERIRKQRREEQERNVQKKKRAVSGDADEDDDEGDDDREEGEREDEGDWDDEEEIDESEVEEAEDEEEQRSTDSEPEDIPPPKRAKRRDK